jgi:hypothetical protein
MHETHHRRFSCRRKRFKISLEVVALDVVAPFRVTLNGNATMLPLTTADELVVEVGRCDARQHERLRSYARSQGGARMRCCRLLPPSLMMRMAATTSWSTS